LLFWIISFVDMCNQLSVFLNSFKCKSSILVLCASPPLQKPSVHRVDFSAVQL